MADDDFGSGFDPTSVARTPREASLADVAHRDLATLFGVSDTTLKAWRCRDDDPLPYAVAGNAERRTPYRYDLTDVLAWAMRQPPAGRGSGARLDPVLDPEALGDLDPTVVATAEARKAVAVARKETGHAINAMAAAGKARRMLVRREPVAQVLRIACARITAALSDLPAEIAMKGAVMTDPAEIEEMVADAVATATESLSADDALEAGLDPADA